MTPARETTFVLASLAIHLVGGLALAVLHPRAEQKKNSAIVVEVHRRQAEPSVIVPRPDPARRQPEPTQKPEPTRRWPSQPSVHQPPVAPLAEQPPPVAPPPTSPPVAPPKSVDLFNRKTIEMAMGMGGSAPVAVHDPGGTTRRAGDGKPVPGARDKGADKEEAAMRIHDWMGEGADGENLKSGRVAPRWREAERALTGTFHPPVELVTDENAGSSFLKQWANTTRSGGTVPRGEDDSRGSGFLGGGTAGASESSSLPRTRAEVEVVIAADGSIVSAKIVSRSGRRKFDEEALAAVKNAVSKGGPPEEKAVVVTRWAVEAWVKVAPPTPVMGFTFDESTGKVGGANTPMKTTVNTHVALLSVRARN